MFNTKFVEFFDNLIKSSVPIKEINSKNKNNKEDDIKIINDFNLKKKKKKYYDNKNIIYKNKIIKKKKKIKLNKIGNYSYENKCLMNFSYNIILFSTILHILFSSGICITWAFLGIFSILKSFGIIEDSEKKYYYDMIERANKIYEQVNNNSKESKNIPEENVPLNVDVK